MFERFLIIKMKALPVRARQAKKGTIGSISVTSTRERSAVSLQLVKALFVFGIDHAGAKRGVATKATLISEVEQAMTPVTLAVGSYLTIQDVPVAIRCHWSSCLGLGSDRLLRIR